MKKQTSVEWLFEQVVNRTERVYFLKELEQAKEMERVNIIQAFQYGNSLGYYDLADAEQYYNETFKNTKE